MRQLRHFVEAPRPCGYVPSLAASLENRLLLDVGPLEYEAMLVRGWRRFGPLYFRPACASCFECVPIRLPVERFAPSDSQKKALRRCRRFRVDVGPPLVDDERLELYAAWHQGREERRGWDESPLDTESYFHQFGFPHPCARELTLRDHDRLVAVGICDVTPKALSAVYFFYHPDIARLSPGVANVLLCVELARSLGIPHVYLGYRVLPCASMRYKARFHPHELLRGRPRFDEAPIWEAAPAQD